MGNSHNHGHHHGHHHHSHSQGCDARQASQCERRFTWFDWAASIFEKVCDVVKWVGFIGNNTKLAAYGRLALYPVHLEVNAASGSKVVTVPPGAISIQAVIDNDYASTYRLTVQCGEADPQQMPAGTDLTLPVITPVVTADDKGVNACQGYGFYPDYTFTYPSGSKGFVTAIYRDDALQILIDE